MRYEHLFTYDQDEHEKSFLYDNKGERTGVEQVCSLINVEVNRILHSMVLDDIHKVDSALMDYFNHKTEKQEDIGVNVIKSVSEAVLLATASCYQKNDLSVGIN
jgi:enolase